jgi:hypothetical protein
MPFARVAQHRVLQSNSSSVRRRADETPVHELSLDTNFTATTPSQYVSHEQVNLHRPFLLQQER